LRDVNNTIARVVDFYNNERFHISIGMMTPAEASQCSGEMNMRWTSYRDLAIKRLLGIKITEKNLPLSPCHWLTVGLSRERDQ